MSPLLPIGGGVAAVLAIAGALFFWRRSRLRASAA
jgi:hypothetical protein